MSTFILSLLFLTNAERVQPLVVDPVLMQRAEQRADYLCESKQWSHDYWLESFKGTAYERKPRGENLARRFDSATSTHNALMASPTHRANIVDTRYKSVGIAHKCNLTVELFGG